MREKAKFEHVGRDHILNLRSFGSFWEQPKVRVQKVVRGWLFETAGQKQSSEDGTPGSGIRVIQGRPLFHLDFKVFGSEEPRSCHFFTV